MALTADQYVQRVEDKLLRQVFSPDNIRNLSYDHVNDGIAAFLAGHAFLWALDDDASAVNTIAIASGEYIVAMPTGTLEIRSIERWSSQTPGSGDTQAGKLREKSLEWLSYRYPNLPSQVTGRPRWWTRSKYGQILIAPPSDGVYYIHVRRTLIPAALVTASSTVSIIPDQYDQAVIAYAVGAGFEVLRQYDAAQVWMKKFENWRGLAILEDKSAPDLEFTGEGYQGPGATPSVTPDNYWELPEYRGDPST